MENNGFQHDNAPETALPSEEGVRFIGTFHPKVAPSTSQVTLPRNIKKVLEEGREGHLVLVPRDGEAYWQLFTEKAFNRRIEDIKKNRNLPEEKKQFLVRKLARSSSHVEPDTQGRFVLPKAFMEKLGETYEVTFESAHSYINLWAKTDFDAAEEREKEYEKEMQGLLKDALEKY